MNRKVALVLDRRIRGRDGYGVTRLAEQLGRGVRTVHHWCDGGALPNAADLLRLVAVLGDDLADELLQLVGLRAYRAPPAATTQDLAADGMRLARAAGELVGAIGDAIADGEVSASEQARISSLTAPVVLGALHVRAEAQAVETQQLALVGGAR